MAYKALKIKDLTIDTPIVQGGMGVGVSWDKLAGTVSKEGGLGVISSVGTGYYQNQDFIEKAISGKPSEALNFYSGPSLVEIFKNARKICGDAPLACNVLYASVDYGRIVMDACKAGADAIITGAGLPTNMPEFTKDYPEVALIPIVSSAKALKIICKRWTQRYDRLPDAVIVEGPKSGGHQGFTYEQCSEEQYQLENLIKPVVEERDKWGDFPVIAAGGIWDKNDIDAIIKIGADGVQMGTRFIATQECDAHDNFKEVLLAAKEEDIKLLKSPVGYPTRGIQTNLIDMIDASEKPPIPIKCISNCVSPCNRGEEAKEVGYCIADRLSDAALGNKETGLFFTGTNGYKIDKIITVKELMHKLTHGEDDS